MTAARPRFSVLLPTFNRADILPLAIQSVLDQTLGDFELIISDGGSTDETNEVIRGFDDRRIRHLSSDRRLSMSENYEAVSKEAVGEYLIFFSDDDAFVPSMLERIQAALEATRAEMIIFPFAKYYLEADEDSRIRSNSVVCSKFTGSLSKVVATDDLEIMSGRFLLSRQPADRRSARPLIGNVVLKATVIERIREQTDSLFAAIPVDGYFITLVLSTIKEYFVIDLPLLVWSQWRKNSSIHLNKNLREHYEHLLGGQTLDFVPLKTPMPVNCSANAILKAAHSIGRQDLIPVDWGWYFLKMHEYLVSLDAEGIEVMSDIDEVFEALKSAPIEVQDFFSTNRSTFFHARQHVKKSLPFLYKSIRNMTEKLFPDSAALPILVEHGGSSFQNVRECARCMEKKFDEL